MLLAAATGVYMEVLDFLRTIYNDEDIIQNADMKQLTTFKVGGCADFLVYPKTIEDIKKTVAYLKENNIFYKAIGNCSNLIVSDKGIRGVLISLAKLDIETVVDGKSIIAPAREKLKRIALLAYENSLTGFEFAAGIPGTLGGAIKMNAGAYDGEMSFCANTVWYLDGEGNYLKTNDLCYSYRHSFFSENPSFIIIKAKIDLKKGDRDKIKEKMDEYQALRAAKQPLNMPSAGSVFKRPKGYYAGALIEGAGLKGYKIGGGEVSEKHAGFIVNTGNATSKDVLDLIKHIQKCVFEKYNVMLETEVEYIGEE